MPAVVRSARAQSNQTEVDRVLHALNINSTCFARNRKPIADWQTSFTIDMLRIC